MDEEIPNQKSSLLVEFRKKDGKLYISVSGLEAVMDEIINSANGDESDMQSKKEMQEIILKFLDKGKVTALTEFL